LFPEQFIIMLPYVMALKQLLKSVVAAIKTNDDI